MQGANTTDSQYNRSTEQLADTLSWDAIRQQCPRCETFKASIDLGYNPRFGILCGPCMDKMINLHQPRISDPMEPAEGNHPVIDPEEMV
jgi:hypothetical protein